VTLNIVQDIQRLAQGDAQLARLFERVREYAELFLIAKQRQKGCDGMGEVATLKDEFIYSMDGIIKYCKEKGYLSESISYEIDSIVREICNT